MFADVHGSQKKVLQGVAGEGMAAALDVGCGPGAKTAFIARHSGSTVGIDPAADQIRQARERYGGRHLQFAVARAEALCFSSASFDAVFFNESLHHVPAECQEVALHEARRVLKPRGQMLIIEPVHGSGALGGTLRLYLDERSQERKAAAAIEALLKNGFERRTQTRIQIVYGFEGVDDFYGDYLQNRPDALGSKVMERLIRDRFDRCRRDAGGITLIDYTATVWHLVKK